MKKSEFKIFYVEIFLLLIFIFNIFVSNFLNELTTCLILLVFFIGLVFLLGFEKDNFRRTIDILLTLLIFLISYYLFIYIIGIFLGFLKNGYSLAFINIIRNIIPVIFFQVSKELLRYQINIKGEKNKFIIFLSVIIFILIDVSNVLYLYDLSTIVGILKLIELNLIPIIAENLLLTYVSIKGGYKINILYCLLLKLPIYLVPIIPDLGEYLELIFKLILPCALLYTLVATDSKYKKVMSANHDNMFTKVSYFLSLSLLILVVYLTSGIFTYYAITIGSESMQPYIDKGDIVVVKKVKDKSNLNIGDILVYEKESKVIVHRIVDVQKGANQIIYFTKGDANESIDNYPIYEREIIGIVKLKIKYLGIPTVRLKEIVK